MGKGNNFSILFNTEGTNSGIYNKTALLLSGTKTAEGIQNLQYAFVMVEKGDDPEGELMEEGIFRVFKDGDEISYYTSWPVVDTRTAEWIPEGKKLFQRKETVPKERNCSKGKKLFQRKETVPNEIKHKEVNIHYINNKNSK